MAEPISIQQLKDASEDAITLADFIYKPANVMIPRRLAADINSLQYYLDYMSSYAQHSYETYDEMFANAVNLPSGVSAFVTNDLDTTKNGMYTYNGVSFVKGEYQPEKSAIDYVEAKLGGLQVFDGKVRAQDISTIDGNTQDVKNTLFQDSVNSLEQSKVDILSATKTVTVGATGADFTTINAALSELSRYKQSYIKNNSESNTTAKILLKSGFVAAEQININGVDFGWVDIVSQDAEVVISRAALTTKIGRWYSFIRCKSGVIPSIKCLFSMDNTGTASERVSLYMINSDGFIEQLAGFKNSGDRNVDLTQGSTLNCSRANFTGAGGVSVRPATSSRIFMQYADVSNSGTGISCGTGASVAAEDLIGRNCGAAVLIQGGCSVDLTNAILTGATGDAIHAEVACTVNAMGADVSNAGEHGVYATNGATIGVAGIKANNCLGSAGIRSLYGAQVIGNNITATGNKIGLYASRGGNIVTDSANLKGNTTSGITASEGGTITTTYSNTRNDVAGVVDSINDARVLSGSTIYMQGSTGGTNQKSDRQTASGIIYRGAKNQASGAAIIPASATFIVVTHTLDALPFVQATPVSSLGTATKYWVTDLTATTFRINIDVATTAVIFNWTCEVR